MAVVEKCKGRPLSMRLSETDIAIIDRAAHLCGRSRIDFVREAAVRTAEEVLMENILLHMSPNGFAEFAAAIAAPGKPVPELVRLFKRKASWEKKSGETKVRGTRA